MVNDIVTESARESTPSSSRRSVVEVVTRGERRRRWSEEDRARILTEAMAPGAIASHVARCFGVSSGGVIPPFLVGFWRRIYIANPMKDGEVLAKRDVAEQWCRHASDHAASHGGKPWTYVLIPHDAIAENMTLAGLARQYGSPLGSAV